jgi:heme-degrading monooxygenase HmoA
MGHVLILSEMVLKAGCEDEYFEYAKSVNDALKAAPGFIRSERFKSLAKENKYLSLSVWEDERSAENWRNAAIHREGQSAAREHYFKSYHITAAEALREYTGVDRRQAPVDSNVFHDL